jgi:predicted outer membrane protein
MKNSYLKLIAGAHILLFGLLAFACSSNLSYNEAIQRNTKRMDDPEKLDDARFLVDAASYNLLATRMAEAAVKSGYSASLVSLAKENLEQHEEMGKDLKKLARKEHMVLPAEMNDEHQRMLAELTSSDRREFDRTYIRILSDITEDDREKFSQMATEAKSEEIRAFAARQLGLFNSHKTQFETVDAELLRTY